MQVIPSGTHYLRNVSAMLIPSSGPNRWNSSGKLFKLIAVNGGDGSSAPLLQEPAYDSLRADKS